MTLTNYNLNFEKLCATYKLGLLSGVPEQISGGFLHRMYRVTTNQAEYAVKALNPQLMRKEAVMNNMIAAEKVAVQARRQGVSALPALLYEGSCIHEADGQYYLLFPWIEGRSVSAAEAGLEHCILIGQALADIHAADFTPSITSSKGTAQWRNCGQIGWGMPCRVKQWASRGLYPLRLIWTS